jgi:hypothetical protein
MTSETREYVSIMTLRSILSFVTVAVTVTGITTMPVEQLRMS